MSNINNAFSVLNHYIEYASNFVNVSLIGLKGMQVPSCHNSATIVANLLLGDDVMYVVAIADDTTSYAEALSAPSAVEYFIHEELGSQSLHDVLKSWGYEHE